MNSIDTHQSLSDCKKYFKTFELPFSGEVYKLTSPFFNRDLLLRVICLKKTQYGHIVYAEEQNTKKTLKFFSNTKLENTFKELDSIQKGEYIITTPVYVLPLEMKEYNDISYRKLEIYH